MQVSNISKTALLLPSLILCSTEQKVKIRIQMSILVVLVLVLMEDAFYVLILVRDVFAY